MKVGRRASIPDAMIGEVRAKEIVIPTPGETPTPDECTPRSTSIPLKTASGPAAPISALAHRFFGGVIISNVRASDGTVIEAWIGELLVTTDETSDGEYDLLMEQPEDVSFAGKVIHRPPGPRHWGQCWAAASGGAASSSASATAVDRTLMRSITRA